MFVLRLGMLVNSLGRSWPAHFPGKYYSFEGRSLEQGRKDSFGISNFQCCFCTLSISISSLLMAMRSSEPVNRNSSFDKSRSAMSKMGLGFKINRQLFKVILQFSIGLRLPYYFIIFEVSVNSRADRRMKNIFAKHMKNAEAFQLVFHRVFHFCKMQFNL